MRGLFGTIMLMQDDLRDRLAHGSAESADTPDSAGAAEPPAEEQVDEAKLEAEFGPPPDGNQPESDKPRLTVHPKTWIPHFRGLGTARQLIYGLLVVLAVVVGWFSWAQLHQSPPTVPAFPTYHKPTSHTVPSTLTGLQVDPAVNKLPVTGVMIENSLFARPQSGLSQAGVVFEAIAEAGITRFLALFQDTQSQYLGPVRSARPYFVKWCQTFDCSLAHVGGSPEALSDLKKWHVNNLDEFAGAAYFHRINSRYAPHNMYTSQAKLSQYEKSRGYTTSQYTGFAHLPKAPKPTKVDITTTSINFNYPGSAYDVHYGYNAKNNDYLRSEGGKPHYSVDAHGKKTRNAPKVVLAMVMSYGLKSDHYHSEYDTVGSGTLYVFQNGTAQKGTWSKASQAAPFVLKEANGQTLKLDPGQAWISIVSAQSNVSYK